jgi:drug/metabolite transporter (DMT)-like permease
MVAIPISFCGVLMISTHGEVFNLHFANPFDAVLVLSSSLLWAFFGTINIKDRRDEVIKLLFSFSFGFLYTLILTLCFSEISFPPIAGLVGAAYIGMFEMGITFLLWLKALSFSRTTAYVGNIFYISPFLSLIISFTIRETILPSTDAGLFMIVCGVVIQKYSPPAFYKGSFSGMNNYQTTCPGNGFTMSCNRVIVKGVTNI